MRAAIAVAAVLLAAGTLLGAGGLFHTRLLHGGLSAETRSLHAALQSLGLLGCFVVTVALQVLPGVWGFPAPGKGQLRGLLLLIAGSLLLRTAAWFDPPGVWLRLAGDALGLAAGLWYSAWVLQSRVKSEKPPTGADAFLVLGSIWWPVGMALWLAGDLANGLPSGIAAGQETLLWGFVLSWFLGMAPRLLPEFGHMATPLAMMPCVLAALHFGGVFLRVLGHALEGPGPTDSAGNLLIGLSLLLFAACRRWSARLGDFWTLAPVLWLGIGSLSMTAVALMQLHGTAPPIGAFADAARHSIAAGFAMGLMLALAPRLLPVLTGSPGRSVESVAGGLLLFHIGVLGRWGAALAPLLWPGLVALSGLSGFAMLLGMGSCAFSLLTREA